MIENRDQITMLPAVDNGASFILYIEYSTGILGALCAHLIEGNMRTFNVRFGCWQLHGCVGGEQGARVVWKYEVVLIAIQLKC